MYNIQILKSIILQPYFYTFLSSGTFTDMTSIETYDYPFFKLDSGPETYV